MESTYPLDNDFRQELGISGDINGYLAETAKWAKFLSIVSFVVIGFMVLAAVFVGIFMQSAMSSFPTDSDLPISSGAYSIMMTIYFLLFAALYFFPTLYLYRFANKMKAALTGSDQSLLTESFSNLKSVFKFWGIMTAVIFGLYALILVFAIIGGVAAFAL